VKSKGMTLAEIIVTGFLLFMLFSLAVQFLIPCLRAQTRGTIQAGLEETGTLAVGRLTMWLQQSAPPGISLYNANPAPPAESYPPGYNEAYPVLVAVIPIKQVLGDTTLEWADRPRALSYDREARILWQIEWPQSPPPIAMTWTTAGPERLTRASLLTLADPSAGGGTRTSLCRNLAYFDISHSMGRGISIGSLVTFTLRLEGGASQQFRIQRQVHLRN